VRFALYQARSALRDLLKRWELKPIAEWGEDEDGSGSESDASLVLDEDLYAELLWSHNILVRELEDGDPPAGGPGPESADLRGLAQELSDEGYSREAGVVGLLIDREFVPFGPEYLKAVHKGRKVKEGSIRSDAHLATKAARARGIPIRYKGEADGIRRVPPPA
jgi:hypothetical protein